MDIISKIIIILILLIIIVFTIIYNKYEHFATSKIDIWVINLDKDEDRLVKFKNNVKKNNSNLNVVRYPATLGKKVKKTDKLYRQYIDPKFKAVFNHDATVGCAISHASLYNKLYNTYKNDPSKEYFIICEDDAVISDNFSQKLNIILKELPSDWDFVYLGSSKPNGKKYSDHLIVPEFKYGNWGFFGYMFSKRGLEKAVNSCKNIDKPIDNFLKHKGLKYFTCNPFLITHDFDNVSNLTGKNRKDAAAEYNKIVVTN